MTTTGTDSCRVCREPIIGAHVSTTQKKYHKECFVCHQCLEPFKNNIFFEAEGNFYCEDDHSVLYGARCAKCGDVIVGKCVSALDAKWHIEHFNCENCGRPLVGSTFIRKDDKPYCKVCPIDSTKKKNPQTQEICANCKRQIFDGTGLLLRGQAFHASHFTCATCCEVLTSTAKEYEGKLFCMADYEKNMAQICYACRKPIVGRSTSAIGKIYHPEHFSCWKCEKPFDGAPYFELNSQPYCEAHYKELTGSVCQYCKSAAKGNVVSALGTRWCEQHFMCMGCFCALADGKVRFMEWDNKPMCKRCYEKLPSDVRKNVSKYKESEKKFLPIMEYGR
ncbi:hypothetical protein BATDEDRAFT_12220 [Batrachochytrium dendrobatidis JAM81]|uniref:LIM zinc-binding domain-containing protein n=1 Tax=Batrachochytrium dendrobatidis (strain JAM81 / FGSC 10211) TaxID=684364 RepID=F4P5P5_BATDJ|nr:uncharacterized protein BATDEDRAFT_12220 [Batrachochytrium dendrobatidis JAM81]EGF79458.1 hypothetical protein BATDEDRAFT_12220 [Batrachochytrium dendrobatidis JAM81]|eukprot:XP_006679781.1 hypothetical protein BATDEDRAFT_12220 [Batrachochytrium dendrobatidis JAM81]